MGTTKSNVIDMTARRKAQMREQSSPVTVLEPAQVVGLEEKRKEILTQERRQNRRTILSNFLGAFVVVPDHGLKEVGLYDISEGGVSFDLELASGQFRPNEELAMRVYLSKEIYVPFQVKVKNVREIKDENVSRHGTNFVASVGDDVLKHFVKFVEAMSQHLKRDTGDLKLPNQKG
ncbi:MAG: PilZ domain-containing protein [Bdellovibrionia bacterium]